ncbi:MAG TPA: ATP-binding protein [Humisphaera sp.]
MTLRQKISWQIGGMLVGLLTLGGASLWGIRAVHQDYGVALDGYVRLRHAYGASARLHTARTMLQWAHPKAVAAARAEVLAGAEELKPLSDQGDGRGDAGGGGDSEAATRVRGQLARVASELDLLVHAPGDLPPAEAVAEQQRAIDAQAEQLASLAAGVRTATERAQAAADAKRHATVAALATLCAAVVLAAVVLAAAHYRGVMGPVRRLTAGVRRLAAGQFKGRVDVTGNDELSGLARDFNRMAGELDAFYHQLEQKVADKTRELTRSERLASVGYLAAGVAHEINNPLSIISGYAEYSIAELERVARADGRTDVAAAAAEVLRNLRVICDEAFRCKGITAKLLSLARGADGEAKRPVDLLAVAREVAGIVGGLRDHRDKRVVVRSGSPASGGSAAYVVPAVEAEMKQVLLNLTVNALEAVAHGSGEVRIELRSDDDAGVAHAAGPGQAGGAAAAGTVELTVTDNGRGMAPDTLDRAFEPFFTDSRAPREDGRRGTGLGLSIVHAIVRDHGGSVTAHSDGPGRGSRFTVRLPMSAGEPVASP